MFARNVNLVYVCISCVGLFTKMLTMIANWMNNKNYDIINNTVKSLKPEAPAHALPSGNSKAKQKKGGKIPFDDHKSAKQFSKP